MKKCPKCKRLLSTESFCIDRSRKSGRGCYCKTCDSSLHHLYYLSNPLDEDGKRRNQEKAKRWYYANPGKSLERNRLRKYGLSKSDFDRLKELQNSRCLLCQLEKKLIVDHCHISGKVRGLLCYSCNTALGKFKDSPSLLRKAAEYVENAKIKTTQ